MNVTLPPPPPHLPNATSPSTTPIPIIRTHNRTKKIANVQQLQNKLNARKKCVPKLLEPLDKTYFIPTMRKVFRKQQKTVQLATVCPDLISTTKRKLLVDLGANFFNTSVHTFQTWYQQGNEFMVHAFEPLDFGYTFSECVRASICTYHRAVLGASNGFLSFRSRSSAQADSYNAVYHQNISAAPTDAIFTVPMHDITEWFASNVNEDDYVVLKMDIEGAEWAVMEAMRKKGTWRFIDEFYFECHHKQMSDRYKDKSFEDCRNAMLRLRNEEYVA
eukprot:PhF_6_TR26077/c0_g1_i8/m.36806